MQKTLPIIIGIVAVAGVAWYFISSGAFSGNEPSDAGDVVAIVNGEEILRADLDTLGSEIAAQQGFDIASLDAETRSQYEGQIVDELIAQALLRQAVGESGITAAQEEVDAQVDATVAQLGGEEAFQQALVAAGFSEDIFRARLGAELAAQTYLERELNLSLVSATDEEVEAAYAQAVAQDETFPALPEVRGQVEGFVIQQKQQALAAELITRLRAKADVEIML